MPPPRTNTTTSRDGTTIAYTTTGIGLGLIIIGGNNRMAHDYERLAAHLAPRFTVHVIERRGRGASGPQGKHYALEREIEDLQAVLTATGAAHVFGHSYGGLIALQAARTEPRISSLVAYEPAVSLDGSFDLSWLPRFDAAFRRGHLVKATVIFLKRSRLSMVSSLPTPLVYLLAYLLLIGKSGREMRALMPTTPAEIRATQAADSDGQPYETITARTLLLAGDNGAQPIIRILPRLQQLIPHATYQLIPRAHHNTPDLGPVEAVAAAIGDHLRMP